MAINRNSNKIFDLSRCIAAYRALLTAFVIGVLCVVSAHAQEVPPTTTYSFKSSEQDSVHTSAIHNYQSEAERANDALLITEVKKALADDGVAAYRAVVVDCDHGTISLDGIVGSSADAQRAATVARDVDGVVAVKNNLKWP
jgi:osmotically-inducible protein OsmY